MILTHADAPVPSSVSDSKDAFRWGAGKDNPIPDGLIFEGVSETPIKVNIYRRSHTMSFFSFLFFFLNLVHCMCLYIFLQLFVRRIVP